MSNHGGIHTAGSARSESLTVWLDPAQRAYLEARRLAGKYDTTSEALAEILAAEMARDAGRTR